MNKTKLLIYIFVIGGSFIYFSGSALAECQLSDTYPAVGINKAITQIPVPYSEGETLIATVKTKNGFSCEDFNVEFRVCPIVGSSTTCDQAYQMGNATVKNGEAAKNWTLKKLSGIDSYRIRAVVGTGAGSGTSEVYSPEILIKSGQVCAITNFSATGDSNNGFNFQIRSNDKCENKSTTVQLILQPGGANAQIPGDIVAQGSIVNSQFSATWTGKPSTNNFFFQGAVAGGGTIDSQVFLNGQSAPVPGTGGTSVPGTGGTSGSTQNYSFEIPNPLKGGASDFTSLVKIIAQWIFNLAIPIAVAMIVYAGILFLTAAGEPAKVTKAKEVLKYAIIGLAIILIGSGFVTLIQSILELGGTSTGGGSQICNNGVCSNGVVGPCQNDSDCQQAPPSTTNGAVGNKCSKDSNCFTGLKCKNTICQRQTGNLVSEPCVAGANCGVGLACDLTSGAQQVIDGQTLGSCYQP